MICEKCKKQFKSGTSIAESGKMFGLCPACGKKLRFQEIPGGFLGGALLMAFGTPFFLLFIFNWVYIAAFASCIAIGTFIVWYYARKMWGYIYLSDQQEFGKSNFVLSFFCGLLGAAYSLICAFAIVSIGKI